MRKIRIGTIVSPETFQPSITCKVVLENGQIINLLDRVPLEATEYKYKDKKFNESQFRMIEGVNVELTKNGMFEMTLEDGNFLVIPPEVVKTSILLVEKEEIK